MNQTSVEQDALSRRCFARVDVRGNTNIARTLERVFAVVRIQR
jgi:hypothetical protein